MFRNNIFMRLAGIQSNSGAILNFSKNSKNFENLLTEVYMDIIVNSAFYDAIKTCQSAAAWLYDSTRYL